MTDSFRGKILAWPEMKALRDKWQTAGMCVVFTNGVFDILHKGHVQYLEQARAQGDALIVGVYTATSVKRFKDPRRPIVPQDDRAFLLSCLRMVDAVTLFDQDTPLELISLLLPDVLVKGADYKEEDIVGAREVKANGGRVYRAPLVAGRSTTSIVEMILDKYQDR